MDEEGASFAEAFGLQGRRFGCDETKPKRVDIKQRKVGKTRKARDRSAEAKDVSITFRTRKSTKALMTRLRQDMGAGSATEVIEALINEAARAKGWTDDAGNDG